MTLTINKNEEGFKNMIIFPRNYLLLQFFQGKKKREGKIDIFITKDTRQFAKNCYNTNCKN